ncbi:MAG: DUF4178 domain-containing protein [Gemmatimonadaceae bacterium]|nr:DUF4178 domain-containing protein [Gemmatimonadaceae bacterium]
MTSVPLDPAPARPRARSLSCPSCGSGIDLHAQGWAVSVVCGSCGSVLDATNDTLRILQRHQDGIAVLPRIPLGSRGQWKGAQWELIGFQQVAINVEGVEYSWREYVAFNPYRGFLYLSEYQGHWNIIEKLRVRPAEDASGLRPTATVNGRTFTHFQTAQAYTTVALGEFPWEVQVGDRVLSRDFIAPPYILSAESSDDETTWSMGMYTPPEVIAKAFNISTDMMKPIGVFANQPNPHEQSSKGIKRLLMLFVAVWLGMFVLNATMAANKTVLEQRQTFVPGTDDSAAFVTPAFVLDGRPSSVKFEIDTDADNNWMYLDLALINDASGDTYEVGEQISYYSGSDGDGPWTEGSRRGSARIAAVPAGRYFLRVAPQGEDAAALQLGSSTKAPINYSIRVTRDAPSYGFYLIAILALVGPGLLALAPKAAFETQRWSESDYAPSSSGDDSEDDE